MLEIGSLVDGKYKVLNQIGKGGMSVVYLAMNERANKTWAIKEVRKDGKENFETVKQNLVAETDILKKLKHPHLPSIIDVIDTDDSFLIVMDFIEGRPLSKKLKNEGAQPQEKVVEWAKQICDVLGYLHSRTPAIIYRDMKPSNVMLKPDGNIMIIDFGTAREYKEGNAEDTTCLGTRGYAAPEQYGKHQTDARTDIYCLGVTMYHLVTGHNPSTYPYEMKPFAEFNRNLSSGLERIIKKCTQSDPNLRYQNCAELMYDLLHYEDLDREKEIERKRRFRLFIGSCVATVVFAAGAIGFHFAESNAVSSNYDAYVDYGKSTEGDTSVENFQKAISLDSSRGEAYIEMLNSFLNDGEFSKEEADKMTAILGNTSSGTRSNEDYLKNNTEDYDEFCYQMGLAYYYYYGTNGNKPLSETWFKKAAQSSTLDSKKVARSEKLATIAGYYSELNNYNKAGDNSFTFKDYWNNLTAALDGNLVDEDNPRTALVMYKEAAVQISTNGLKFKQAGVSQRALNDMLDEIDSHLDSDFKSFESEYADDIEEVRNQVENARDQVAIFYSTQEANLTNESSKTDSKDSSKSDGGTSNAKS